MLVHGVCGKRATRDPHALFIVLIIRGTNFDPNNYWHTRNILKSIIIGIKIVLFLQSLSNLHMRLSKVEPVSMWGEMKSPFGQTLTPDASTIVNAFGGVTYITNSNFSFRVLHHAYP